MAKKYKQDPKDTEAALKKLTTRLDVAKKYTEDERKQWKSILEVLDFKREVIVGGTDTMSSKVKYPLLFAAYDNYLSNLTANAPQIVIEADGKEDQVKKAYWKGVLSYVKRKIRVDDLREDIVQSFVLSGRAILKIGRVVETKKTVKPVEGIKGEKLMDDETEAIVKNHSFVEVIDPRRFYVSPETKYEGPVLGEKCPYVIEEMVKLPEYIESTYGCKLVEDELEIIDPDEDVDTGSKNSPKENSDDLKRVRVYSYQGVWVLDGEYKQNCEVLFTRKRVLKQREIPYKHGKKTYLMAMNFRKFFKPKAHGNLFAVMDLDQEYNESENRIRTYIRRMVNPKWAKRMGTTVDEDALLDPDIGTVVDESEPNAVRPLTPPPIDAAIFNKSDRVETLFQLVTGIVYGATALKTAGTATGQREVSEGADGKTNRMTGILERLYEERDIMLLQLEQQYADPDGTDIRITGSDVVEMIRNKKILHQESVRMYEEQQAMIQSGQPIGPIMPQPVDEYDKFQLTEDGKAVVTTYTPEDIQGEFELSIISQSSNRSNRDIQAQQTINALGQANEPNIRGGLWKRFFSLNGWDEMIDLVDKDVQALQPPTGSQGPTTTDSAALAAGVKSQASQVV